MSRHDPEMVKKITDIAEKWLRRCNKQPPQGMPTTRFELRLMLMMSEAVAADSTGEITWRVDGRTFTAEPVRDEAPE